MRRGVNLLIRSSHGAALLALALTLAVPAAARAQGSSQTLPGLVVAVPPADGERPAEKKPAGKSAADKGTKAGAKSGGSKSKSAALDPGGSGSRHGSTQSIVVLVNDDPITAYEIEQRSRLMALQANVGERAQENFKRLIQQESTNNRLREILQETIQANQGKSREQILAIFEERKKQYAQGLQRQALDSAKAAMLPAYRKNALDELIEERLKVQEAKRVNVSIEDAQIDDIIKGIADRNKMTPDQFAKHIKSMGADIESMRARFRATLSWSAAVRRRFSAQVAVSQREIDRMVSTSAAEKEDEVELRLHRITLPVTGKIDQKVMARRLDEAERLWRNFKGCSTTAALAKAEDAKFEDLGASRPSSIPEPTRSLLLNAKHGEMVPPNLSSRGIELYAVCGRSVAKADDKVREQVAQELQQKEFEVLAKRHLRDLRQDAHIEYR
ncbi:MAG: SurA N-terminal domain-containing protein [Hyphomicrobiaceae bacterium]|nr:SurA N-terminal domain-containing protein [Hyphomicrobiaceae bacterium]